MKLCHLAALLMLPLLAACVASGVTSQPQAAGIPAFQSDRISVTTVGTGPDVILIPGLSSSPQVWESTVAALPGYRYHLVQVSGFAGAPTQGNASGPVIGPVAEEIARYVDSQNLTQPALVGHSLGGTIAMMMAARNPDSVSKLMVVDMLPFLGAMFMADATAGSIEPLAAQMRASIANPNTPPSVREAIVRQTVANMVRTESLRSGPIEDTLSSDQSVAGQAMFDLVTTDLRPELAAIDMPMAVLWVYPPNAPIDAQQMSDLYRTSYSNAPQAVLTQVPDSYHFIMFDASDNFHRALSNFLESRR